jgi:hypothetical protein
MKCRMYSIAMQPRAIPLCNDLPPYTGAPGRLVRIEASVKSILCSWSTKAQPTLTSTDLIEAALARIIIERPRSVAAPDDDGNAVPSNSATTQKVVPFRAPLRCIN